MIQTMLRVFVVGLLTIGSVLSRPGIVLAQPNRVAPSPDTGIATRDAVAMIDVVDVSGSLTKAIKSMSDAEAQQLTSTLKPSDVYARINFDGSARIALLMPVREPSDVQRITTVLEQNASATGQNTAISAVLIAAREVVERERGTRSVVLVVITDGILSVPNLDLERKRLDDAAAWWKKQTWARRIVVAVGDQKAQTAAKLARLLDAELVGLDDYGKRAIVARAITSARASAPNPPSPPTPEPAARSITRWLWMASGATLVLVLALCWQIQRRSKRSSDASPVQPLAIASLPSAPEMQVSARVAASGQVADTAVAVADLEQGVLTLGMGGDVFVPGLQGRAVKVDVASGSMAISVEPGTNVRVNGENVDAMPQPIDVGRQCRLTSGGVAIALRLHARGAERRAPVTVTGMRKRRVG